jgi:hypothetical protein
MLFVNDPESSFLSTLLTFAVESSSLNQVATNSDLVTEGEKPIMKLHTAS